MTLTDRIIELTGRSDIRAEIDALVKATRVYVVSVGSYDSRSDVAVFSDEDAALKAIADWNSVTRDDINSPEGFQLDIVEARAERKLWEVLFEANGNIDETRIPFTSRSGDAFGTNSYQMWSAGGGTATVWAKDADGARKVACDLRAAELYRMALEAQVKKDQLTLEQKCDEA